MSSFLFSELMRSPSSCNQSEETPDGLDPLDALGWDMPSTSLQHRFPISDLPPSLLETRFNEVARFVEIAEDRKYTIPYNMKHLQQAKMLLGAPNGYANVLEDLARPGRFHVHGRTWNPSAETWLEKLQPPED